MQGRIEVTLGSQNKSSNVSTLTYLKAGISSSARILMETLMENIVQNFVYQIYDLLKVPSSKPKGVCPDKVFQMIIACLVVLLKNYPEMSTVILSYEIGNKYQLPEGYTAYLPEWDPKETFLSFLIKYASYLFNYSIFNIFDYLINKNNETPIFIDYIGQMMLLSSYNEILVFNEIIKQLEANIEIPEQVMKKLYTRAIWNILNQISLNLLNLQTEPNQKNYKLDFIQRLKDACNTALKAYLNQKREKKLEINEDGEDTSDDEEVKVIYLFLARLLEVETVIITKKEFSNNIDFPKDTLSLPEEFLWVRSLLKEQYYISNQIYFDSFHEEAPLIMNEKISNEIDCLKEYITKDFPIDKGFLLSKKDFILSLNV